jgi:hypothetical protein
MILLNVGDENHRLAPVADSLYIFPAKAADLTATK